VESTTRGSAYAECRAARSDGAVAADDRLHKRSEIATADRIDQCGGSPEGGAEGFGGGAERATRGE
jgi:hypothetical protein